MHGKSKISSSELTWPSEEVGLSLQRLNQLITCLCCKSCLNFVSETVELLPNFSHYEDWFQNLNQIVVMWKVIILV